MYHCGLQIVTVLEFAGPCCGRPTSASNGNFSPSWLTNQSAPCPKSRWKNEEHKQLQAEPQRLDRCSRKGPTRATHLFSFLILSGNHFQQVTNIPGSLVALFLLDTQATTLQVSTKEVPDLCSSKFHHLNMKCSFPQGCSSLLS